MDTDMENESCKDLFKTLNSSGFTETKKERILNCMLKMKEEDPTLKISNFICILHKLIDPTTEYFKYSAFQYISSVNKWNDYNYKNNDFNMLIPRKI